MRGLRWDILRNTKHEKERSSPLRGRNMKSIVDVLLENRGLITEKAKKEFFKPKNPKEITLKELGIKEIEIERAKRRILKAKKSGEKVVVYGDYDADGVTATAIMWEGLYGMGIDVVPYIPDRVSEGYGIGEARITKLKTQIPNLGLIVTVDNGIVANEAVEIANSLGIDVIITDHHSVGKKEPNALAVVHTTEISGAGVAWVVIRELGVEMNLELSAIGTVADQMPLLGANRSIVKWGIVDLNHTGRLGLLAMFEKAGVSLGEIGMREINYVIAPRINASGRLGSAMDSLRLLCTKKRDRAGEIAEVLQKVNIERQKLVEESVVRAVGQVGSEMLDGILVIAHEEYHEGTIGLVASALVEKYYLPAVVFSKGKKISKASARSISGFNIIETVRGLENYLVAGGGHPMAAGFSVKTSQLTEFTEKLIAISKPILTGEVLKKSLRIDLEMDFSKIDWELVAAIEDFGPFGLGNPKPFFCTRETMVNEIKPVGEGGKHLKMTLEQGGREYGAIAFGMGEVMGEIKKGEKVDVVYSLERNVWNGRESMQLIVKDIRASSR